MSAPYEDMLLLLFLTGGSLPKSKTVYKQDGMWCLIIDLTAVLKPRIFFGNFFFTSCMFVRLRLNFGGPVI